MRRTIQFLLAAFALCGFLSASRASAQGVTTAGITGVIKDAQGNLVDEPAPASSFYHLVAAIAEISALARLA